MERISRKLKEKPLSPGRAGTAEIEPAIAGWGAACPVGPPRKWVSINDISWPVYDAMQKQILPFPFWRGFLG